MNNYLNGSGLIIPNYFLNNSYAFIKSPAATCKPTFYEFFFKAYSIGSAP